MIRYSSLKFPLKVLLQHVGFRFRKDIIDLTVQSVNEIGDIFEGQLSPRKVPAIEIKQNVAVPYFT